MNTIRISGLLKMLVWGTAAGILGANAVWLSHHGWQIIGYGWGIPGAFFMAALVQFVSGVPFSELSARWDGLAGWQRGVLGTLILLGAVAFIFACLFVYAITMYGT